ncbi:MAG: hypothetical protein H0W21_06195 [Actinobacteria bacterium]|nr:hypothetical protein [Actinomycetota bacterium]
MAETPAGLPNRRQSLNGQDLDGRHLRLSWAIARQLYRCPGCGSTIEVGNEHVVVAYPGDDPPYYQHWHRRCALPLVRSMASVHPIPAPDPPRGTATARRGHSKKSRRRR